MTTPPITVSIMGGLGNQLFQFATGLEVATRVQAPLRFDLSWFDQSLRRSAGGLVLRPYELAGIADDIEASHPSTGRFTELGRHSRDVFVRRGARIVNRLPLRAYAESGPDFDPRVLELPVGTHLWGYFASWRYFPTVAGDIRRRLLHSPSLSTWATDQSSQAVADDAIALHVRRGDYLALASTYGHVAPDYYRRALEVIRTQGHGGPIWLFSDDPDGAQEFLNGQVFPDHVLRPPAEATSLDSLCVMSAATSLVIANSTYSWWAAFLQDRPGRTIVAPRPTWAKGGAREPRDSLLPHWLTVDCRSLQ